MNPEQKTAEQQQNVDNSSPPRTKRPKEPLGELRTLFLSGLPTDIKEREIHNLMRFFPGYEGCVLNLNESAGRPVCFASFQDRNSALRALRVVQDLRFDPNVALPLRVEFAKTNSKARRLPPEFYADKRRKAALAASASPVFQYDSYPNPNLLVPWFQNLNVGRPGAMPYDMGYSFNASSSSQPQQPSKVPPCSTLFVANLHPDVAERDLNRLFRNTAGFRRLMLSLKDGIAFCFVEYSDVESSTHSMNNLQGFPIGPTSIRIEFARTRMGESKRRTSGEEVKPNSEDNTTQPNENDEGGDDLGIDQ